MSLSSPDNVSFAVHQAGSSPTRADLTTKVDVSIELPETSTAGNRWVLIGEAAFDGTLAVGGNVADAIADFLGQTTLQCDGVPPAVAIEAGGVGSHTIFWSLVDADSAVTPCAWSPVLGSALLQATGILAG